MLKILITRERNYFETCYIILLMNMNRKITILDNSRPAILDWILHRAYPLTKWEGFPHEFYPKAKVLTRTTAKAAINMSGEKSNQRSPFPLCFI